MRGVVPRELGWGGTRTADAWEGLGLGNGVSRGPDV